MISRIAESGAPFYQFEIEDRIFKCHLPVSTIEPVDSEAPQIITLVVGPPLPLENMPSTDVLVMAGASTSCAEFIRAAASPVAKGQSVCVVSDQWLLRHNRGENRKLGKFTRRDSRFREIYIQPVIDGIKTMF